MMDMLLIGYGAIGQDLVALLAPEIERGDVRVRGAVVRDPNKQRNLRTPVPLLSPDRVGDTLASTDLVVECAGVAAALRHGPTVIRAGVELVLTSVGALADADARLGLLSGPGRLTVTNGAIGGFDLLEAAAQADGLDDVSIRTAKLASALVRPWMTAAEKERLRSLGASEDPFIVFEGTPEAAIKKFPANVNVAVALAWAIRPLVAPHATGEQRSAAVARSLERVRVSILADPNATLSRHLIHASGTAGTYELNLENTPSPSNPRTSGLTAMSVARNVREHLARNS